jgi:hypothetical protein
LEVGKYPEDYHVKNNDHVHAMYTQHVPKYMCHRQHSEQTYDIVK